VREAYFPHGIAGRQVLLSDELVDLIQQVKQLVQLEAGCCDTTKITSDSLAGEAATNHNPAP
jgi:hypothetical protein